MIGRKPSRTAKAPATGCRKPQARFCTAIARVKSDTVIAMSWVSGCRISPKLWRTPIPRLSIVAAPTETGISKRTLYNCFPSKDALIAAYLTRRIRPVPLSERPAVEQILGDFDRLERSFAGNSFRGCAFVNAVAELKEPKHEANQLALAFKEQRRQWFRTLLTRLDMAEAQGLSSQLI